MSSWSAAKGCLAGSASFATLQTVPILLQVNARISSISADCVAQVVEDQVNTTKELVFSVAPALVVSATRIGAPPNTSSFVP
jgi:hypothetical protein